MPLCLRTPWHSVFLRIFDFEIYTIIYLILFNVKINVLYSVCNLSIAFHLFQFSYKFSDLKSLDPQVLYDPLISIPTVGTVPSKNTGLSSVNSIYSLCDDHVIKINIPLGHRYWYACRQVIASINKPDENNYMQCDALEGGHWDHVYTYY